MLFACALQLMQKLSSPETDPAAADSLAMPMPDAVADANPMAEAGGMASNPSSSDAATAMEGVEIESHGKDVNLKGDTDADQKVGS